MNEEKKWKRYTKVGDVYVNLAKYKAQLSPVASGCLEWTGPKHRQGYGMVGVLNQHGDRKMTVVHRIGMRLKLNAPITSDDNVLHTCGNKLCCNPAHLFIREDKNRNEIIIPEISTYAK